MLREWELINNDINFYLARGEASDNDEYQTVMHVLGLSYDSLTPRLRQWKHCLSNYKEDEEINAEELYLLWIGEGLIALEDKASGGMMLEVAECYLDELAHRSLVQVDLRVYKGMIWSKFQTFRVHDLIRELCLSKVEEKVIRIIDSHKKHDHESKESNNRVRRLCIHLYDKVDELRVNENLIPQIRSLLLLHKGNKQEAKIFNLKKYKLLRVLTIQKLKLDAEGLSSIGKLVYLKYLSFKYCVVVGDLSSSIGNLRKLETLDLRVINDDIRISNVVWKFKQLKHLYLHNSYSGESVGYHEMVRLDGLKELELIEGFNSKYFTIDDLTDSSKIKAFKGKIIFNKENPMIIETTIEFMKSKELCYSNLHIKGSMTTSCFVSLLECCFIDCLITVSPIIALLKEYDQYCFSGRLTCLWMWGSEIVSWYA